MLRLAGAGPMFGMGGFQLLPFYDAVGLVGLNHHLINDERAAPSPPMPTPVSPIAPASATALSGPGATNLVTGLVNH